MNSFRTVEVRENWTADRGGQRMLPSYCNLCRESSIAVVFSRALLKVDCFCFFWGNEFLRIGRIESTTVLSLSISHADCCNTQRRRLPPCFGAVRAVSATTLHQTFLFLTGKLRRNRTRASTRTSFFSHEILKRGSCGTTMTCMGANGMKIVVGIAFAIFGIAGLCTLDKFFGVVINSRLPLLPGSETYEGWKKIPFPIYQKFYYFNVTNPEGILKRGETPKLVEVGPYTWRAEWVKENVEWNANKTLQYREKKTYWFDREHSVGDQEDRIVTINTPLVAASQKVKNASPVMKLAIALFVNALNESLFIQRSVRQLTYEGYPDVLAELSHIMNKNIPVKKGRFAYMSGKNDTDEGLFNVFTGVENIDRFNQIDRWNGKQKLPWWNPDTPCADIKGTNGELIHPINAEDSHIYFFNPNFCKPWKLVRDSEPVSSYKIALQRFVAGPEVLYNSSQNPDHSCFETSSYKLPSGGMDISRCQFGIPLVLSYPHFYAADASYLKAVEGLSPDRLKHQFSIDIEPRMGIALGLAARAQINIKLARVDLLSAFRNIPEIVLPIFWQEMDISQTPEFANHIYALMDRPYQFALFAYVSMIAFGGLVILGTLLRMFVIFLGKLHQAPDPPEFREAKRQADLGGPVVVTSRHIPLIRKIRSLFWPRKTWRQALKKELDKTTNDGSETTPSAPAVVLNNSRKCDQFTPPIKSSFPTMSSAPADAPNLRESGWIKNVFIPDQSTSTKVACNVTPK